MFPKIIHLSLQLVLKEFEDILEYYPEDPYQIAFSNQELRQELITSILSKIPTYYAIVEKVEDLPSDPRFIYNSAKEREQLQTLISNSIVDIYRENADLSKGHMSQKDNLDNKPSYWFG